MRTHERKVKILSVLLAGKATWTEIQEKTRIGSKELSSDLRELLRKEITCQQDSKDRRKTWYELKPKQKDRALMESKRYETTEFILGMKDPIYHEVSTELEDLNLKTMIAIFGEGKNLDREKEQKEIKMLLDTTQVFQEAFLQGSLGPDITKFALVFMVEQREKP